MSFCKSVQNRGIEALVKVIRELETLSESGKLYTHSKYTAQKKLKEQFENTSDFNRKKIMMDIYTEQKDAT